MGTCDLWGTSTYLDDPRSHEKLNGPLGDSDDTGHELEDMGHLSTGRLNNSIIETTHEPDTQTEKTTFSEIHDACSNYIQAFRETSPEWFSQCENPRPPGTSPTSIEKAALNLVKTAYTPSGQGYLDPDTGDLRPDLDFSQYNCLRTVASFVCRNSERECTRSKAGMLAADFKGGRELLDDTPTLHELSGLRDVGQARTCDPDTIAWRELQKMSYYDSTYRRYSPTEVRLTKANVSIKRQLSEQEYKRAT